MRLAVLSDIHGNSIALDAVLADIRQQGGVDAYWVLGDLVAFGHDPVGVIERLGKLPNLSCTRGNTDRCMLSDSDLSPTAEELADAVRLPRTVQITQNYAWTIGALNHTNWHDTLAALPLEKRLVLEDGTRVLGVHAAPGTDTGSGIHPGMSEAVLRQLLDGCMADLVLVGHTHWAMDIVSGSTRIVNLGSLGNPVGPDIRAKYSLIYSSAGGYRIEHRRVDYDYPAVIDALEQTRNPARAFLLGFLRGEQRPHWIQDLTADEALALGLPLSWVSTGRG